MKKFIVRGIVFVILAFSGYGIIAHIRVSPLFIEFNNTRKGGWIKIHERINRSKEKNSFKRIYIGDSVGNQLFNFDSVPNSLCSNAAVTLAGNYILIENLLVSNPQIDEIILVSVPNDIGFNFEQKLTFNNFIKPFLSFRNLKYFDEIIREKLWTKPISWLYIFYAMKMIPLNDIDFSLNNENQFNYLEEIKLTSLSDIAIHYIKKLDSLCNKNNIQLQIISPPVPNHWKDDTNNWDEMRVQIDSLGLSAIFSSFLDDINYYPDEFFPDGLHLANRHIEKAREELLAKIVD